MEIESGPMNSHNYDDLILQRFSRLGIPDDHLCQGQHGIVAFAKNNRSRIGELVSAILATDEEDVHEVYRESMIWLQWLMFEGDPKVVLAHLAEMNADQRGVCRVVWGANDIAYRCRTCQHDPTCAICVPCFENGNHKDHDYAIIHTGGGCCDCGDITAWKREGFCSKHKGAEQIQPLPEHVSNSMGPVLSCLLSYWKDQLLSVKTISEENPRVIDLVAGHQKAADKLTSAVVVMLLDFCEHSESLLSFISETVYSSAGLLDVLLRTEARKLRKLLLKMLSEPIFKYEFAKVFVLYYPTLVNAAVSECSDIVFKRYSMLATFSVQIFTVATLTLRLVEEMNLFGMLLRSLEKIFSSCAGEDGRLQVAKWANLYKTTMRVVEDIRFVMSHPAVPKYLCQSRQDLVRTWMRLLGNVQGMNSQKRETTIHIEHENENVHLPFILCHSMSNILSLLVAGAFSVSSNEDTCKEAPFSLYKLDCEDPDSLRHAKIGRLLQESPVYSITGKSTLDHELKVAESFPIPLSALLLIYECLISTEKWFESDDTVGPLNASSLKPVNGSSSNFFALNRTLSKFRRGRCIFNTSTSLKSKPTTSGEADKQCFSPVRGAFDLSIGLQSGLSVGQKAGLGDCDDNMLYGESPSELEGLRILSLWNWPDITYDVSSQNISVHIPLHRLLSMILQTALKACYDESGSPFVLCAGSTNQSYSRYSDFLSQVLEGCHPYGFSAFVMEHPLRIRVFIAEVHAGMWRRNGDAPILFSEWYRSVRWSEQGQELDLFLLQCCAALAPPDLYVQRIIERFGLSDYLSLNLEQSSEHETTLVAEMLTLLIQIVKERRFCGLTTAECLQRELVYKLSIGDATRSQLVKSLPPDLSNVDELQEVLDTVAEYSHPSGITQGTYELRSSYWKELDLYHPRWSSRDKQAAEERYLRFCSVSALVTQIPRWTKIYYPLRGIATVATCKTVLQIVRAVLFYAVFAENLSTSLASDGVLLTTLHLLALALDVCRVHKESGDLLCEVGDVIPVLAFATQVVPVSKHGDQSMLSLLVLLMRRHEKEDAGTFTEAGNLSISSLLSILIKNLIELSPECMTKLQEFAPQLANQFSHSILDSGAQDSGLSSDSEKRKAKSRERQAAILEKMRAQQLKFLESFNSTGDMEMDNIRPEHDVCESGVSNDSHQLPQVICSLCHDPKSRSPVSYLVLLQKSRLLSFVDRGPPSWEQVSKRHVSDSISTSDGLSSSSISDGSEMISSSEVVDLVQSSLNDFASMGQPTEVNAFMDFMKSQFPSIKNVELSSMSSATRERPASSLEKLEEHMSLFIRGYKFSLDGSESTAGSSRDTSKCAESLLLGKYIAALPPLDNPSASQSGLSHDDGRQPKPNHSSALHPHGGDGIYVSTCGHAVHQECLDRYLSSLRERYVRRVVFEGRHIVDPDQGEFLCPVCRGLANSLLPALSGDLRKVPEAPPVSAIRFTDVSSPSTSSDFVSLIRLEDGLSLLQRAAVVSGSNEILKAFPTQNERVRTNLKPILRLFCEMYYPGQDKILDSGRASHSMIFWDALKYSLISAEIAARSRKSSLSPNNCLGSLYEELNSSTGFTLSLLLDAIQTTQTTNSLTVLLRLLGTQLFNRSLCSGPSPSELSNYSCRQGGSMLYILENVEAEVQYLDIQFWRRASEPVLAHDAFSSLMGILFCLPWPILSCEESFLSLVHVFYVVTVTQAIITCSKKRQSIKTEMEIPDCLITDIYQLMGECGEAVECFDYDHFTPAYDIKDSIRSLTFPYLRRCALLRELIKCSNSRQFTGGVYSWGGSFHSTDNLCAAAETVAELAELEKFEKMFKLPPLDVIFNDEKSRLAASRWVHHVSEDFKAYKHRHVLRCTPAIPFTLMRLPRIYQDLLQRFIKKHCPYCGAAKQEPVLCLLCGKLCSPNWKTCCRESGCQSHAKTCGAGIGVFLLVRRTTILLQRSARQALWPSPYLDAYGEEDVEMHRGKPLFLNEERYAALTHMVASHGLDRSSEVLRQTTLGSL